MQSIRKINTVGKSKVKTEPSITKLGKVRKVYTQRNPRKVEVKPYALNIALTDRQKEGWFSRSKLRR